MVKPPLMFMSTNSQNSGWSGRFFFGIEVHMRVDLVHHKEAAVIRVVKKHGTGPVWVSMGHSRLWGPHKFKYKSTFSISFSILSIQLWGYPILTHSHTFLLCTWMCIVTEFSWTINHKWGYPINHHPTYIVFMDYQPYISPMNHWISLGYHEKNHGCFHHGSWDIPKSRIHCVQQSLPCYFW